MAKLQLATLLTDFGSRDAYPACMKGVILSGCPRAQIVDISHEVPAHDVLAAAMVLEGAAPCFPPDTLHVIVVDPGVGTDRAILAGRYDGQTFLFPDNGVISLIADHGPAEELVAVRNPEYLPTGHIPATFHGRDIFAPLAARLLNGLELRRLGPPPSSFTLLDVPKPAESDVGIAGQVIYVDAFGNLVTNIPEQAVRGRWADLEHVRGFCGDREAGSLQGAYAFVEPGSPLVLFNSMGRVELAVNRGRACDFLHAGVGAPVRLAVN